MRLATFFTLFLLIMSSMFAMGSDEAAPADSVLLWTQEGESEGVIAWIMDLANRFHQEIGITVEVVSKDTEALREDFQTATLAGTPPDLLWTVSDHAGPFLSADLLESVGDLVDSPDGFAPLLVVGGEAYGVPISVGNHLMLMYNTDLVDAPPATTDELIELAKSLTNGDRYGLVYNQIEPFWLVPWLGGFGGKVFADDGVTPDLNTQAMVDTLQFLYDLKLTHKVVPQESDYAVADGLFKDGKAAMLVNGDWSISDYRNVLGNSLGVASLPKVSKTGQYPAPYTSGKYFMVTKGISIEKKAAIKQFVNYVLTADVQEEMLNTFDRLPSRLSLMTDSEKVRSDDLIRGSAAQLLHGTPMPVVAEMRAIWDSMKPEMNAVLADSKSPRQAAQDMQSAAESTIQTLNR